MQLTDIHLDPDNRQPRGIPAWDQFLWAVETARGIAPDLTVITGDLALETGSPALYREIAPLFEKTGSDVLLLPGNHDSREDFEVAFGRRYRMDGSWPVLDRVIDSGGVMMLLLDTADGFIHGRSLAWLDSILHSCDAAAGRGERNGSVIIWTHHPPLTGFHRFMDRKWALKNGDDFLQVCRRYRDRLAITVFCGHYHTEHKSTTGNVTQYCTPSTYMQLSADTPEFRIESSVPALRLIEIDLYGQVTTAVLEPAGPGHTDDA